MLSSAILAGASQQLRNMASTGGNLLQRTRCHYFYDVATPCNKREPGSGCSAIDGHNRMHAILGASDACIATHPSDMCVALAVLEAQVHVSGPAGERAIAFAEFHRLPGDTPQRDTNLQARRDRHGGGAAGTGLRRKLYLSEDPRPAVLRLRACVSGGRAGARRRQDQRGAIRARRGRAQAMARSRRRGRACAGKAPDDARFKRAADALLRRRQGLSSTTPSRSSLRAAPSSARSAKRRRAGRNRNRTRRYGERHGSLHRHPHVARRRPRQGHRGGKVRRRVQRGRPRLWQRGSVHDRQGAHPAHRHQRGTAGQRRDRRADA